MASPFNVFRKHQKVLIATLGLLAMIAFVILPNVLKNIEGHGPAADPVVVKSKYGDLTESQLQSMRHRRQRMITFLQRAVDAAGFDREPTYYRRMAIEQFFGNAGEESTVDLWILVQRANQLGMTISDSAVSDFIASVTDNRVTNQQFAHLYKTLKISENEIFDTLQNELLARELEDSFRTSLSPTPPGLRWEFYQRLNRRVSIQLAAIPVSDYLDKVEDPDDEVLEKFFEAHKGDLANPNSAEPGFRVPAKVAVEYVKADFKKYLDVTPVTDEEIEAYYMKNRGQRFVKPELPGLNLDEGKKPEKEETEKEESKKEEIKQEESKQEEPALEDKKTSATGVDSPFRFVSATEEEKEKEANPDTEKDDDSKYQPLDEVREEIRETLTTQKRERSIEAFKEIETSMQPIRSAISKYRSDWNLYRATGEEEGAKKPVKPDLAAIAKEQKLTFHETGLVSPVEMNDLDIGLSMVEGRQSFLNYIFNSSTMYRPKLASDLAGNAYLFWKTDSTEERIPKFEDEGMKAKVLAAWKMIQARKLAKEAAEKLAEEAGESKKTLEDTFGSRMVVQKSGPFSWITKGPIGPQGQPRLMLSNVEHVEKPGDAFLRTVYDLEAGQTGVAMNEPQTIAYLVQLEKSEPSDNVLWIGFKADPYSDYAAIDRSDKTRIIDRWIENIRNAAKLKWERKPVPPTKNR